MINYVKHFISKIMPVYLLFYGLAQMDVFRFVGFPETCKQCVGVFLLANSIAALCFSLPLLVGGRAGKCVAYFELLTIALIEFVEIIVKIAFGSPFLGGGMDIYGVGDDET